MPALQATAALLTLPDVDLNRADHRPHRGQVFAILCRDRGFHDGARHIGRALPIAAAVGGMVLSAVIYQLVVPQGPWSAGWGVPMATDTAFALAIIALMGARVPVELRIFLTAASIVDDIGAIIVVAIFYSGDLRVVYLVSAAAITALLSLMNRVGIYHAMPMSSRVSRCGLVCTWAVFTPRWLASSWRRSFRRARRRISRRWRCRPMRF